MSEAERPTEPAPEPQAQTERRVNVADLYKKAGTQDFMVLLQNGKRVVPTPMKALNLLSLYAQLLTVLPMFNIARFWVLNGDGTELLADCNLEGLGKNIAQMLGRGIMVPTEEQFKAIKDAAGRMA